MGRWAEVRGALTPSASVVVLTWLSTSPVDAALSAAASMALYQKDTGAADCAWPTAPLGGRNDNCTALWRPCASGFNSHSTVLTGPDGLPAADPETTFRWFQNAALTVKSMFIHGDAQSLPSTSSACYD